MIAHLSCSISCWANENNCISPTGEVKKINDSVYISYDDLKIVNSKLIELNYEKEINTKLRHIVTNDSVIIENHIKLYNNLNKDCNKYVKQRNIYFGIAIVGIITSIILLVK